jgi:multimeric flavodoxin WrbA
MAPHKITAIMYSTYGHNRIMVDACVEGLRATGAEVNVVRVAETLPEEVLAKMHAAGLKHNDGVPVVDPHSNWHEADGAWPGGGGGDTPGPHNHPKEALEAARVSLS